jgi:hypothetical protein
MSNPWIQAALTTAALTLLQMFLSFLVPPSAGGGAGGLGFVLLSNALTASLLVWIARRLRVRGLARAVVLWAIWGGIQAISLIELLVFDIGVPRGDLPWLALHSLAVSACLALFLGLAFPAEARAGGAPPAAAPPSVWWRLAASGLAYVVLYFAAGMLAYPYVREFYEARPMPAMGTLLVVQPVRGLAFGAIVLLVVRQIRASRFGAAVAAGSTISILGGVAPLLIPNPYLPDAVRYAHLPEVGVSNFLFGLLAGWLLAAPRHQTAAAEAVATASA